MLRRKVKAFDISRFDAINSAFSGLLAAARHSFLYPLCKNLEVGIKPMVARINTVAFYGIDVQRVDVQVQISNGLPAFTNVGYINLIRKNIIEFTFSAVLLFLGVFLGGCTSIYYTLPQLNPFPPMNFHSEMLRAEKGDPKSQAEVAFALEDACHPRHSDSLSWRPACDKKACSKWYRLAAENGNPRAQERLGFLYRIGEFCDIEKDVMQGIKWHQTAADQNYIPAMLSLAQFYEGGLHVEKSEVDAAIWYKKAADAGDKYASMHLAKMYAEGKGVDKSTEKARAFGLKAQSTDTGNQFKLGVIYAETYPPDYKEAYYWTSLARTRWKIQGARGNDKDWPSAELERRLDEAQISEVNKRISEWIEADKVKRPLIYD